MDKSIKYKQILRAYMQEMLDFLPKDEAIETMCIKDEENGQYLMYTDGWKNNRRDYSCLFHVQIKPNGKVYMRHDGTDLDITAELIEKGIEKEDIVIMFHAPYKRKWTDFATA